MMVHFNVQNDVNLTADIPKVNEAIKQSIVRSTLKLLVKVKNEKLSGQVLKVRSGRLRRSITQRIEQTAQGVVGIVGTNVGYGKAHEYGLDTSITVKAHLRQIKQAFGKSIAPKQIQVKSHTRQVKFTERSFLRTALQELQSEVKQDLQMSIARGLHES